MSLPPEIEIFENEEVNIEHFDGCPTNLEMTASGFSKPMYGNPHLPSYRICLCYFHERQGEYITLLSDQEKVGSTIIAKYMEDPNILLDLYATWLERFQELLAIHPREFRRDITSLTNDELLAWSDGLVQFMKEKVSMPGFIDGFMFYAERRLAKILKEYCDENKIEDYPRIYSTLTAPVEPSFINEEEAGLHDISRRLAKVGYSKGTSLEGFLADHTECKVEIDAHLLKYSWIKSSYVGYTPYMLTDIEAEIARGAGKEDAAKIFVEHVQQKEALMKQYAFTPEILAIAKLSEILVKWQDQRKNYTLVFVSLRHRVLEEVARRSGIDIELLRYVESDMFPSVISGKCTSAELKARVNSILYVYQGGKTSHVIVGKEAKEFFDKLSAVDIGDIKELKGTVASLGKAKGTARVIISVDEIGSVHEGDILIASMTRPEHLPGMRKAAAIVTDDGGITCHAAIVARELKKPCIIGTKLATKVFKNGDMLEVDANTGIVRLV